MFTLYIHGLLNTRPYMSHLKAKIKSPVFRKFIVLWIYEILYNSGERKKNYGSSENKVLKIWQKFSVYDLFISINTLFLFALNKQVKAEVRKQPFKCVPKEKIKK